MIVPNNGITCTIIRSYAFHRIANFSMRMGVNGLYFVRGNRNSRLSVVASFVFRRLSFFPWYWRGAGSSYIPSSRAASIISSIVWGIFFFARLWWHPRGCLESALRAIRIKATTNLYGRNLSLLVCVNQSASYAFNYVTALLYARGNLKKTILKLGRVSEPSNLSLG